VVCRAPLSLALAGLVFAGCGRRDGVDAHLDRAYPEKLSEWRLFTAVRPVLRPNAGVLVYDVNTPLFSDYSNKFRTVWMPPGSSAEYRERDVFSFPVGTIFTKTFGFPQKDGTERLIETRVLVRQRDGWTALPYVWNREQSDAVLDTSPVNVPVHWVDRKGQEHATDYTIPNVNQCTLCHQDGAPLGPTARNVNRGQQIVQWVRSGYLNGAPQAAARGVVWNDPSTGNVGQRATAYLDVNCGTCHAAGRRAGPLPALDKVVRTMESLDPNVMMPNVGHTVVHKEAVNLVREWMATPSRAQ
jgi:uncharacterized repeat protein (TIGR03806 family)